MALKYCMLPYELVRCQDFKHITDIIVIPHSAVILFRLQHTLICAIELGIAVNYIRQKAADQEIADPEERGTIS